MAGKKWDWKSSWGWEDSYFGGYYNVLERYPEVKVNSKVDWQMRDGTKNKLSYYSYNKLIKLFLHRVTERKLQTRLITGMTKKSEETKSWFGSKEPKEFLELNAKSIEICIRNIGDSKDEFSNLIEYFKQVIIDTSFRIPLEFQDATRTTLEILFTVKASKKVTVNGISALKTGAVISIPLDSEKYPKSPELTGLANKLVAMLDIEYDPKSDRVNNLRAGKLDTNKLVEASCGNPNIYYQIVEDQTTKPFSVCILCDESGSMGGSKIDLQGKLIKILWETFSQILPPSKIYIYGHTTATGVSGKEVPMINIYNEPSSLKFEETILRMGRTLRNNMDGPAIEIIHERVRNMTDENILFISLSDGQPSANEYGGSRAIAEMKKIIEMCRRDKFVTAGIGIYDSTVKTIYPNYVILNSLDTTQVAANISRLLNHVVKTEFQ